LDLDRFLSKPSLEPPDRLLSAMRAVQVAVKELAR